jgi:hypothetical protein
MPSPRRFPPPWMIEELNDACFVVSDADGQRLVLLLEWQLVSLISHMDDKFSAMVCMCIQQLHRYHIESCLLSMRAHPNTAMALTRMACELSRDILRMSESHDAEMLWCASRKSRNDKAYKKVFRFKTDDPSENALYNLYDITSDWGVHGHILETVESGRFVSITNREFVLMEADKESTVSSFALNLSGIQFFMLAFLAKHKQIFLDATNSDNRDFAKNIATNTARMKIPTIDAT